MRASMHMHDKVVLFCVFFFLFLDELVHENVVKSRVRTFFYAPSCRGRAAPRLAAPRSMTRCGRRDADRRSSSLRTPRDFDHGRASFAGDKALLGARAHWHTRRPPHCSSPTGSTMDEAARSLNLPAVVSFLTQEFRRFERERAMWLAERSTWEVRCASACALVRLANAWCVWRCCAGSGLAGARGGAGRGEARAGKFAKRPESAHPHAAVCLAPRTVRGLLDWLWVGEGHTTRHHRVQLRARSHAHPGPLLAVFVFFFLPGWLLAPGPSK